MENRIYGIITMGLAVLIYAIAWRQYRLEKYSLCIFFIVLGGLILRIFTSMDFYLHPWDERYHALVAKNLIDNPWTPMLYSEPLLEYDFKNWSANHIWVHKQPVPLYSMALSMWIFGKNVIALRMPSILLSTISIFATFKIGEALSSKKVGLLAAFLFSINGLIIELTAGRVATDHIDVFFFSLITIAIYLLLKSVDRKSNFFLILGSIVTGLAILSKWLPALIVLPIWLLFAYKKIETKRLILQFFLFLGIVLIVVLPWQIYIFNHFPAEASWEYQYNKMHIFEALGPHGKPFYYHFDRMRIIFGEIVYLPLIWLLWTLITRKGAQLRSKAILVIWILVPYAFFSFAVTKMQGYILFCAPALFIMIASFFEYLQSYPIKLGWLKSLILVLLIALPIRYSIERIKPFANRDRSQEWIDTLKSLEEKTQAEKVVVFNSKYPIEAMFHSDFIAYERIPTLDKLSQLHSEGYLIYMDNHLTLKEEYQNLDIVHYVKISNE